MKDRVVPIANLEHFVGRPVAAALAAQGATVAGSARGLRRGASGGGASGVAPPAWRLRRGASGVAAGRGG